MQRKYTAACEDRKKNFNKMHDALVKQVASGRLARSLVNTSITCMSRMHNSALGPSFLQVGTDLYLRYLSDDMTSIGSVINMVYASCSLLVKKEKRKRGNPRSTYCSKCYSSLGN